MKVVTVVGARPALIKAAVVAHALRQMSNAKESIVHTGQHYDPNMSGVFFEELEIPMPNYHLGIGSGPHGTQTGRMLEAVEGVLIREKPAWVVVYGDTNSALAGALAAAKLQLRVAHVEAGLRSFNRRMPEEVNRVLTDHVSDLLFAPTDQAILNLRKEALADQKMRRVGDVMFDAALQYAAKAERVSQILNRLALTPKSYVLATVHRAEKTDDSARIRAIVQGLAKVAEDLDVVFPVHPRTRLVLLKDVSLARLPPRLRLIEPVGYLDMLMLERCSRLIATDSGGIQKEAFFYRVPCVTFRDETEWVELVELGWNRLVPPVNARAVCQGVLQCLQTPLGAEDQPYGRGDSARLTATMITSEAP